MGYQKKWRNYQLSEKGSDKTRWRLKPWGCEKVGWRGAFMKSCMNWSCLGLESLVPRDKPNVRGSSGTGQAEPSSVFGVEMSKSQNPPPSITHLSFLITADANAPRSGGCCCSLTLLHRVQKRRCWKRILCLVWHKKKRKKNIGPDYYYKLKSPNI